MIKAIIFDLDGTLLNRDASLVQFINSQYERLYSLLGQIPKEKYTSRFIELDQRGYVWKDQVYQQLIKEYDVQGITEDELLNDYIINFKCHCVPFGNLIAMLEDLKKSHHKLGVISNGMGQFQMDTIEALGIAGYFDEILISEWEGLKKPDPRIFMRALERLNTLPTETVFVGDHPFLDIEAARKIGMIGIWKKNKFWSEADADFIVDDLNEIPVIIKKMNNVNN